MSTRQKKTLESNDDSEIDQLFDEEEENKDDEQVDKTKERPKTKKKIGAGSDVLHILPIQLNIESSMSTKASVDAYFEPFIRENDFKAKDSNFCQYTATFRGHPLNGKKNSNVQGLTYYQLLSHKDSIYEVNQIRHINEYYLWQYDDSYAGSNPLNNIKQTISKLDILS